MPETENRIREITRIVVRPLASGLPLGFFAFAVGTILLACVELKWVRPPEMLPLVSVLLAYVAPLELASGVFAFLSCDTGAGTTMALFGSGWVALALYFLFEGVTAKTVTFGVFLAIDALAILALAIVSSAPKPLMAMVLFRSSGRFMLAAAVQFGAGQPVNMTVGSFGLITGVVAIYGGLALLWEDVKQSSVLPVFRRSSAKRSLEGSLDDQLRRLDHEAGVRQQL